MEEYPWEAPPFEMKAFDDMSKKEAKQFFDWYVSQIPERIKVLEKVTKGYVTLDFTKESLIDLFSWFLDFVTIRELTEEEIGSLLEEFRQYPDHVYQDEKKTLLANPVDLEQIDYAVAMDIAIYYGETIIKNYPQVKWTYFTKPKSYVYLNEPILSYEETEFPYERNPRSLMRILAHRIKDKEATEMSLYETFLMDEKDILGIFDDPED
ncbi:hypothetical protein ACVHXO_11610 [Bacillus safensis]|uniref:hypothetical protein n=1 Tax=Bacillus TaxID=1386 RepID=UPI0028809BD4|nr:hypothetical protein [Bacillus sp. SG20001]WNF52538.1 hypothetical protein RHP70_09135 [Bacillus sp. SG20001]